MKAADRTKRLLAFEMTEEQRAAYERLQALHHDLTGRPTEEGASVITGVYLALQGIARRDPAHVQLAVTEGETWHALLGGRVKE